MRVLVIQTAFLGDCILSLPFLARACELLPNARIDIVATGAGAEIFRIALQRGLKPWASRLRVIEYDKKRQHRGFGASRAFAKGLSPESGYDVAFCLQRSLRSALLAIFAGARERIGFSSGSAAFLYTRLTRRAWDTGHHEIERNLDLLRTFLGKDTPVPAWSPRLAPSLLAPDTPAASAGARPIVISLGSPWPTKRWPTENAIPLIRQLTQEGHEVRLLGDAASAPIGEAISSQVDSLLFKDLSGKTSLLDWLEEIRSAQCVLSGDSAAVHAACDLGVPVLALFGPTLPEFGFAPWRPESVALGLDALPCRPCHIHGPKVCPLGHHRCLKELRPEAVGSELRKYLDPSLGTR